MADTNLERAQMAVDQSTLFGYIARALAQAEARGAVASAEECLEGIAAFPQPTYEDDDQRQAYETATDDCAGACNRIAARHRKRLEELG